MCTRPTHLEQPRMRRPHLNAATRSAVVLSGASLEATRSMVKGARHQTGNLAAIETGSVRLLSSSKDNRSSISARLFTLLSESRFQLVTNLEAFQATTKSSPVCALHALTA